MAQNITLLGASYSDVPGVTLPKTGGGTALYSDPSITTAIASDVAQGKQFLLADGSIGTGTASGGGGSSSYTLLYSTEVSVNSSSTSAGTVTDLTISGIWADNVIVFVSIRDKSGKRSGRFWGSDCIASGGTSTGSTSTNFWRNIYRDDGGTIKKYIGTGSTGYGVYANYIDSGNILRISRRYNSTYSLTINSTYSIKVYALKYPENADPFA